MLIRSQNRDYVVLFNSCECVYVSENTNRYTYEKTYLVKARFNGAARAIGEYGTEKRAKEILEEIIEFYTALKVVELGVCVSFEEIQKFGDMKIGCYDMPAE